MSDLPSVTRHYPKISGLARRTEADVSQEFLQSRPFASRFLVDMMDAKPASPKLVSSIHGPIGRLLLTVPQYAAAPPSPEEDNPLAAVYKDLLQKMPPAMDLLVATHESVKDEVASWVSAAGLDNNVTIVAIADHLHFSVWAEDGYVIATDEDTGKTYFVEPYEFPRYADALIADFVSNNSDLFSTQAPLYFQGGNLLIGDDFFMIGADYPANSLRYLDRVIISTPGEEPQETIRRLYREYLDTSRNLIYVGSTVPVPSEEASYFTKDGERWEEHKYLGNRPSTTQPLFHIDMFITLAGRNSQGEYQVLVGDPRMAAEILGMPLQPHSMAEIYDNVARGLNRIGFDVIRNPLPLVYVDDPEDRQRIWYFATANNALLHTTESGQNTVWLPSYGHGNWRSLAATDKRNREIWEQLGFEVRMLGDFHPFAENLGAVHCIKKYLKRL